jgi:UDP-2,3-diacylglucosamine pyrophosphatase LpxH
MEPTAGHRPRDIARIAADQRVWIVSDLHLGDGTPNDAFFGKDRHLEAFLDQVDRDGGTLVLNGDIVDVHQAWNLTRILRAHPEVFAAMSRLGREGRLVYVIGNHDHDLRPLRDVLAFDTCDEVHVGDALLVRHGHEYDPYILGMLDRGQWHTLVHHLVERWLGTWLRLPLGEFYTLPNRLMFWLVHKAALVARAHQRLGQWIDLPTPDADEVVANLDFWCWCNAGDSMGIFRPALADVTASPWRALACGHSHLPGVVHRDGHVYANSGSWTFAASQYLVWDGADVTCHDWITGRAYGDELYRPMLDGSLYEQDFFAWWAANYQGWLRFREGEERRGQLRPWETLLRDQQRLAELRDVPAPPAPARPRLRLVTDRSRPVEPPPHDDTRKDGTG